MPHRLAQLILAVIVVLLAVPVLAAAQAGGPDLPPVPDSLPGPSATPDPVPVTPAPSPVPRYTPRYTPRPSAPAATGPTPAQVAAARAAARRAAAARKARARKAAIARQKRREAALLRRRSEAVRDATSSGVDAVNQQVANLVEAVRARPAPAQAVDSGTGGGGATYLAVLALMGAAGIGGLAFVRRRTGGRRFSPRVAISSIVAVDRRQVGVLIAAAFVIGAAAAAAILAYLIVNPSAVG
ncbi:MAG: hypothetical protein U0237_08190 [Thermoleophilia bacterium]